MNEKKNRTLNGNRNIGKKLIAKRLFCQIIKSPKNYLSTLLTGLRLALAVVARAGGLGVQAERAGHRGQLRGQHGVDLLGRHGPLGSSAVAHRVPAVLLQHLAPASTSPSVMALVSGPLPLALTPSVFCT